MNKSPRKKRIAQAIRDFLARTIDRDLKDPRVRVAGFVGVNQVELNRDGSVANVYVSFYGGDAARVEEAMAGLVACGGFLRTALGRELAMKRTPQLRFMRDESPEMNQRLAEIVREDAARHVESQPCAVEVEADKPVASREDVPDADGD